MKTQSFYFSRLLGTFAIGVTLVTFGLCYTNTADAAQGCGYGYHMNLNGRCVPNYPGPNATPILGRPNCWLNGRGFVRCF